MSELSHSNPSSLITVGDLALQRDFFIQLLSGSFSPFSTLKPDEIIDSISHLIAQVKSETLRNLEKLAVACGASIDHTAGDDPEMKPGEFQRQIQAGIVNCGSDHEPPAWRWWDQIDSDIQLSILRDQIVDDFYRIGREYLKSRESQTEINLADHQMVGEYESFE